FPEQVAHIINDCRMKALITTKSRLSALAPILKQMPSLSFVVVLGEGESPSADIPVLSFESLCAAEAPAQQDGCIEKDLAAILYTSGSTGKPKGVMLTHSQIMAGASSVSAYLGITQHERILAILPFSFDAGLNQIMTA